MHSCLSQKHWCFSGCFPSLTIPQSASDDSKSDQDAFACSVFSPKGSQRSLPAPPFNSGPSSHAQQRGSASGLFWATPQTSFPQPARRRLLVVPVVAVSGSLPARDDLIVMGVPEDLDSAPESPPPPGEGATTSILSGQCWLG